MLRDWFWQLATAGQGPDWFFGATFAPADATSLALRVHHQRLPGFVYQRIADGPCRIHTQPHAYDLYADAHNAAALANNIAGQEASNIWVYHVIEVCGPQLAIERGYGGYPDSHGATETNLLRALAQAPELTLVSWEVGYGGQGYPAGQIAAGATAAELLAYLEIDE
jgi:hypothetical protein